MFRHGAKVFQRTEDGTHCLHAAAQRGQVEVIKAVMQMSPKVDINDPGHDGQVRQALLPTLVEIQGSSPTKL